MAWLAATPKPPEGSRRAERWEKAPATTKRSRAETMGKKAAESAMPPNPMPHVIERFIEMGMVEAAGMGTVPLGWQTIAAWSQMTGVRLCPWEARTIRRLSVEYLAEGRRAEAETCPPPWKAPVSQADVDAERAALERLLG
ncbi:hypothetical protein [Sphingomonas sp.]|uniref:phage tail assembly chaperone n=1 Tax=Sphingomonas sp. TaxID=28214 RepID=UPI0031D8F09A